MERVKWTDKIKKCSCAGKNGRWKDNAGTESPKNTDNAKYVEQDGKLIIFQHGTHVRNRTLWALLSIEVSVPHAVNKT